ncbi:MAG TPA: RNA-directed DNA polymerase, partial [Polyangiaceae bacterium]|nr:RNA-directed DNA polymerase [Polyangiaceae bacterium]
HAALRQARLWAGHYRFALHLDVTKFFPSIDHEILIGQLRHDVSCARTIELCARIISASPEEDSRRWHFPGDDLFAPLARRTGLPIGNLTSQHFANRYLSPIDHRAKDGLRIRAYLRYMDDMLLFAEERAQLEDWGHAIEQACWRQRLRLHRWQVVPVRQGITFLGFRLVPGQVRVKRASVLRARKRLKVLVAEAAESPEAWERFVASLRSTLAHWSHGDTWRLRTELLRELGMLPEGGEE